jgi:hypothetical protein
MAHQQNPPEHWNSYRPTYEPRPQQGPQSIVKPRMNAAGEYCNPNAIPLVPREQHGKGTRGEPHAPDTRTATTVPQSRRNCPSGEDKNQAHLPRSAPSSFMSSLRPESGPFTHTTTTTDTPPTHVLDTRRRSDDVVSHSTLSASSSLDGYSTAPADPRHRDVSSEPSGSSAARASVLPSALTALMGRASRAYDVVVNYARDCELGTRWCASTIERVREAGLHLHDDIRVLRRWEREAGGIEGEDWELLRQDADKVEKLCKYVLRVISETEHLSGFRACCEESEADMVIDLGYGGCGGYGGVAVGCAMGGRQLVPAAVGCVGWMEHNAFPRYHGTYGEGEGEGRTDARRELQGRGDEHSEGTLGWHVLWR